MKLIDDEGQRTLSEALHTIRTQSVDIDIQTLIQDKKFMEILNRMADISFACKKIAIVIAGAQFRLNSEKNETPPTREVS